MDRWELDSAIYDIIMRVDLGDADEEDIMFLRNLRDDLNQMELKLPEEDT